MLGESKEYFGEFAEILAQPMDVVKAMAQNTSDTYEIEGASYMGAYVVADVMIGKATTSAISKAAGKGVSAVDDIAGIANKADDVADVAKTAGKVDDVVDAAKTAEKTSDVAEMAAKAKYYNPDGSPIWPPNRGFNGNPITKTLEPGTLIDRYGYDGGTFVSPKGTPYTKRSLPTGTDKKPYTVFEVVKPVDVQAGEIASWFGETGGGIQYEFSQKISELLEQGILRKVEN